MVSFQPEPQQYGIISNEGASQPEVRSRYRDMKDFMAVIPPDDFKPQIEHYEKGFAGGKVEPQTSEKTIGQRLLSALGAILTALGGSLATAGAASIWLPILIPMGAFISLLGFLSQSDSLSAIGAATLGGPITTALATFAAVYKLGQFAIT